MGYVLENNKNNKSETSARFEKLKELKQAGSSKLKSLKDDFISMVEGGTPFHFGDVKIKRLPHLKNNSTHSLLNVPSLSKLQEVQTLPGNETMYIDSKSFVLSDKEIDKFQNSNSKKLLGSGFIEFHEDNGKLIIKLIKN